MVNPLISWSRVLGGVGVCLTAFFTLRAQEATAQSMLVPLSECSCTRPIDVDDCCKATQQWCSRFDGPGVVTAAGTPMVLISSARCENCGGCPDNPPQNDLECTSVAELSYTETASSTISSQVTVGIPGINASLSAALGMAVNTTATVSNSCTIIAAPCFIAAVQNSLTVTIGKTAQVAHQWTTGGVWTKRWYCLPGACPIAGNPWNQPCGTGVSTGIATLVGNGVCSSLPTDPCPINR